MFVLLFQLAGAQYPPRRLMTKISITYDCAAPLASSQRLNESQSRLELYTWSKFKSILHRLAKVYARMFDSSLFRGRIVNDLFWGAPRGGGLPVFPLKFSLSFFCGKTLPSVPLFSYILCSFVPQLLFALPPCSHREINNTVEPLIADTPFKRTPLLSGH